RPALFSARRSILPPKKLPLPQRLDAAAAPAETPLRSPESVACVGDLQSPTRNCEPDYSQFLVGDCRSPKHATDSGDRSGVSAGAVAASRRCGSGWLIGGRM